MRWRRAAARDLRRAGPHPRARRRHLRGRPRWLRGRARRRQLRVLVGGRAAQRDGLRHAVDTDPEGTPRIVVDAAGNALAEFACDAFGQRTGTSGAFELDLGYAGGLHDPLTGLVRFGCRDDAPAAGRFLARDPLFLGGRQLRLDADVDSSPIGDRDPTGLFCVGASGDGGFGAGGSICVGASGVSLCGEVGLGAGKSLDVQPFAQPAHTTYTGFELSACASLGPIASVGAGLKYGQYGNPYDRVIHCFAGGGSVTLF